MFYNIKVGTITNAQRAKNALKNRGVRSTVTRLKRINKGDGCGYAVQVETDSVNDVIAVIENERIIIRGVDELDLL